MPRPRIIASYTGVLMLLGVALIIGPLLDQGSILGLLIELAVVVAIVGVVSQLPKSRLLVGGIVAAAALSEIASFVNAYAPSAGWIVVDMGFGMLLIALVAVVITANAWRRTQVDVDTIVSGLAVYVLLGVAWAMAYQLLEFLVPGSFVTTLDPSGWGPWQPEPGRFPRLFFFSFVTLTTLGYGDIVPANLVAGTLTSSEAVIGPIYLTVLVARLVGMHVTASSRNAAVTPLIGDPGAD